MAVSPQGTITVTGCTDGALPGQTSSGDDDVFVRQYHRDGTVAWTDQFGSSSNDYGYGVAVSPQGTVTVTGYTVGALPGQTSSGKGTCSCGSMSGRQRGLDPQVLSPAADDVQRLQICPPCSATDCASAGATGLAVRGSTLGGDLFDWLSESFDRSPLVVFLGAVTVAGFAVAFIWVVLRGIREAGTRQPPVVVVTLILGIVTIIALVAVMVRPDVEAIAVAVGTGIGGLAGALGLAFDRHREDDHGDGD